MKTRMPPFPWKHVLTFLYLLALLAGGARLLVHDWAGGLVLLALSFGLYRLWVWLWPSKDDAPDK